MRRGRNLAALVVAALVSSWGATELLSQGSGGDPVGLQAAPHIRGQQQPVQPPPSEQVQGEKRRRPDQRGSAGRRRLRGRGHPSPRARRLRALFARVAVLPPEQQRDALEGDEFFRRLPLMAQERFHRRLRAFNQFPPEQRRRRLENMQRFAELGPEQRLRMRRRAEILQRMTPEQRQRARRVFRAWRELPPPRRKLLRERLHRLQKASPVDRRALFEEPEFLGPLHPGEQQLLRGLWRLRQSIPASEER